MSQSVLYKWLTEEERLKVKLFFYQTLNEFLNVSAKREYRVALKKSSYRAGIRSGIPDGEKPADDLGEIAFDLVCKEAGIRRHSVKWYELLESSPEGKHPLYRAIGKGVALVCTDKASKQKGLPFVSSYDYKQFAEHFCQKISGFDKSLKIYAYVNKKCLKIQRRLNEASICSQSTKTISGNTSDNVSPTRVASYAFSPQKKCGMEMMY